MIIFQKLVSFVYKPKYFWMIHHKAHFIFKIMHFFMGSGVLVSHRRLCKPRHFYGLSPLGTMSVKPRKKKNKLNKVHMKYFELKLGRNQVVSGVKRTETELSK